jgi:hypothetical protein
MGTKNNPGKFDCYAHAEPDEPMFILLGRDPQAGNTVRKWVALRRAAVNATISDKLQEALECADAMDRFYSERLKR